MKVYIILKECQDGNMKVDKAFASYEAAEKYIIQKYWPNHELDKAKLYASLNIEGVELE